MSIQLVPTKQGDSFGIERNDHLITHLSESELETLLFQYWAFKLDQHVTGGEQNESF